MRPRGERRERNRQRDETNAQYVDPRVMDPFLWARHRSPTDANRTEDKGSSETCLNHALKMGRLEECVEERVNRFGQRIPASAQKRRKEAKQTEQFD